MSEQERAQQTAGAAVRGTQPNNQKIQKNTAGVMKSSAKHHPAVGSQDRYNQRSDAVNQKAPQNTTGVMKSSADHHSKEAKLRAAQVKSDVGIRGTQSSGKYDQDWHDDTFKKGLKAVGSKYGKTVKGTPSTYNDRAVSQQMLKQGADPKKLVNSIEKHSPNLPKDQDKRKNANHIVSSAMRKNAEDIPRPDRVRQKLSHEVSEARKNASSNVMDSSKMGKTYQERIKQMEYMRNNMTR